MNTGHVKRAEVKKQWQDPDRLESDRQLTMLSLGTAVGWTALVEVAMSSLLLPASSYKNIFQQME